MKKILMLLVFCLTFIPITRVKAANFYKLTMDSANGGDKQELYMHNDGNDINLFNKLDYDTENYANITNIGIETPTRKGYAFGGYYIKNSSLQLVDQAAKIREDNIKEYIDGLSDDIKNIEVKAKWEKLSYRVDLIANGRVFRKIYFSNLEDAYVYSKESLRIKSITVPICNNTEYEFAGYYAGKTKVIDENGNIILVDRSDSNGKQALIKKAMGKNKSIYIKAKWKKKKVNASQTSEDNSSDENENIGTSENDDTNSNIGSNGESSVIDSDNDNDLSNYDNTMPEDTTESDNYGNDSINENENSSINDINNLAENSNENESEEDDLIEDGQSSMLVENSIGSSNDSNTYDDDFTMQYETENGEIEEVETEQLSQNVASDILENSDSNEETYEKHGQVTTDSKDESDALEEDNDDESTTDESDELNEDTNTNSTTDESDGLNEDTNTNSTTDKSDGLDEENNTNSTTDEEYEKGGTTDINTKEDTSSKEKYAICYLKDNNVAVGESKNFTFIIKGYKGYKYSIKLSNNNQKIIKLNGRRFTGLKVGKTKVKLIGTKNNKHYLMKECTIMVHTTPMKKSEQKIIESDESKNDLLRNTVNIPDKLTTKKSKKIKKITCKTNEIKVGKTKKIKFGVSPANANKNVKLKAATAASKKKISINGTKITGKKAGTAKVVITSKSNKKVKKTCKIKIVKKLSKTSSTKKNSTTNSSSSGSTTVKSNNASSSSISNPSRTKVNKAKRKVSSVKLIASKKTIKVGNTVSIKSKIVNNTGVESKKWISSNEKVATVSSSGKVKALSPGKTTIKLKVIDKSNKVKIAKIVINVKKGNNNSDNKIVIRKDSTNLVIGGSSYVMIVSSPSSSTKCRYSANNKKITISGSGAGRTIYGKKLGKSTLTIKCGSKTKKIKYTISKNSNTAYKGPTNKNANLTKTNSNEIIDTNYQSVELVPEYSKKLEISKTEKVSNPAACKISNNNNQVGVAASFRQSEEGISIFGVWPGSGYIRITCGNYYKDIPYSVKKFILDGDTTLKKGQCSSLSIVGNAKKCDWKILNGGSYVYFRKKYGIVNYSKLNNKTSVRLCGVGLTTSNSPKLTVTCGDKKVEKYITVKK